MRQQFILLPIVLLAFFESRADTLHLKNGRSFEGTITAETPAQVTIKEDQLTLTFSRSKIARIEKSDAGVPATATPEVKTPPASGSREPPPAFEGFFDEIRKLESSQLVNQRAKSQVVKTERQITKLKQQQKTMIAERAEFRALAKAAKSNSEHNRHIRAANDLLAQIDSTTQKIEQTEKALKRIQASLNGYANQAMNIRNDYQRRLKAYLETGRRSEHEAYFDYIHKKMAKHEDALATGFQAYKGNSLIVRAQLNNRVSGTFIVDTGATMLLFHRALAEKLGIDMNGPKITATLADGSTKEMTSVNLSRVTVNGMTAFNVKGAVADDPPGDGIDGLLGMSFLSQFDFQLDIRNGRLILNPRR